MTTTPVISINLDKNCTRCGGEGAMPNGYCLSCAASLVTGRARRVSKAGRRSNVGTEYADAPDVRRIARKVIDKHHPHLREVRVEYVFVTKTDKEGMPQPIESKGKEMLGRARKVSGLNAFVSREQGAGEEYFVIEVSGFAWRYLTEEQREALVDHELCHCALDPEKGTPTMRTHDVEEFGEIIQRHGLWKSDVQTFIELGAKQLKLDLQPEQKKAAKKAKTAAAESGH